MTIPQILPKRGGPCQLYSSKVLNPVLNSDFKYFRGAPNETVHLEVEAFVVKAARWPQYFFFLSPFSPWLRRAVSDLSFAVVCSFQTQVFKKIMERQ